MRTFVTSVGIATLTLAGCSKAPEEADPGPTLGNASTAGLAFTYAYNLTLPARAIDELQEAHAAACEALGPQRCRITGITYDVDRAGDVSASLSANVAAPLARRFGRDAVTAAERAGATLTGAHIGGTEAALEESAAAGQSVDAQTDLARIDRELARSDLPAAERTELQAQRAGRLADQRTAAAARSGARDSIVTAPVSFNYATGRGSGFANQLRDSGDTALNSAAATFGAAIWLVAALGPPFLALLVVILLWIYFARPLWRRLLAITARGDGTPYDPA
ncbi:hypothetical protein FHT00_000399 [Sphingomonas insulae]|uniref:DUF4349 domain-containing protein n=1 Tax=Sphingomonas insulae TaxID=424800 RepID=A0ABN1HV67_9SPHN|nr:hypothetical protein [Sphingomonas insulae]NIJ28471.1 hypothetical protein [Sphingomonas insulae]